MFLSSSMEFWQDFKIMMFYGKALHCTLACLVSGGWRPDHGFMLLTRLGWVTESMTTHVKQLWDSWRVWTAPLVVSHFKVLPCIIVCLPFVCYVYSILFFFFFFFCNFLSAASILKSKCKYLPFPNNAFPVLLHLLLPWACCTPYLWWQDILNFTVYETFNLYSFIRSISFKKEARL